MIENRVSWNSYYHNSDNVWGNLYPSDFLDSVLPALKPKAKILDIGCGNGRNAIYLAEMGFVVDAFDISSTAIEKINNYISKAVNTNLKVWVGDLRTEQLAKKYDLIIAYGVLNSIEKKHWPEIIKKIKNNTENGGLNAIIYFDSLSSDSSLDSHQVVTLANVNELEYFYSDCDLVKNDVRTVSHSHGLREFHTHVIERFVYRVSQPKKHKSNNCISNIAVIGPAHFITKATPPSHDPNYIKNAALQIGKYIASAGFRLVCIPDGGTAKLAFESYSQSFPHRPAIILKPDFDEQYSSGRDPYWENTLKYPYELITGFTWLEQAAKLATMADILVVIGLSCGTVIEILWTKFLNRPVYMSLDICSKLPPEVLSHLNVFELPDFSSMKKMLEISIGGKKCSEKFLKGDNT